MNNVFVDVDTLVDFFEGGALPVPNANSIKPALAKITKLAKDDKIQVIKFNDEHDGSEPEMNCNGGTFPLHCIKDSSGAAGIIETANKRAIIFPKQTYDVFDSKLGNKKVASWLMENRVTDAYVYGIVGNICVESAVMGLIKLGINVNVFENAVVWMDLENGILCKGIDNQYESMKRMRKAGAHFAIARL